MNQARSTTINRETGEIVQEIGPAVQSTALAPRPAMSVGDVLAQLATPQAIEQQKQLSAAYDQMVDALVGPNDVQEAEGGKRFKKKSAWRKLGKAFQIDTEFAHIEKGWRFEPALDDVAHYYAEVHVRAVAPWGQTLVAVGACSTRESRFYKRDGKPNAGARGKAEHDVLATAATRATNRAVSDLIAAGEVSAEEVEGSDMGGGATNDAPFLERKIGFGKHKELTWAEAVDQQRGYIEWAVDNLERLSAAEKEILREAMTGARAENHDQIIAQLRARFENYPTLKFSFGDSEQTVRNFLPANNGKLREDRVFAKGVLTAIDEAIEELELARAKEEGTAPNPTPSEGASDSTPETATPSSQPPSTTSSTTTSATADEPTAPAPDPAGAPTATGTGSASWLDEDDDLPF